VVADSSCVEAAMLWDLCTALWGSIMTDDDSSLDTSYVCQLARRESLSQWLSSYSTSHINTEVQLADAKVITCSFSSFSWQYWFYACARGRRIWTM